jgi:asparagine synthase (glutamine-hydrolysing)
MPGLVGFTKGGISSSQASAAITRMQDLLAYGAATHKDPIFSDPRLCATRSDSKIIQKQDQPFEQDGVSVWLDGEFSNRTELAIIAGQTCGICMSDAEVLLQLYRRDESFSFLKQIDGIYAAVIYDPRNQRVHLLCDRYGLRHLFWTIDGGQLAWASELKGFLGLPGFSPKIDRNALEDFLKVGHMRGNRTWFDKVQLLPAATTLTWDLRSQTVHEKRYWRWDDVSQFSGKVNETEILEELGDLFIAAVQKRCNHDERVGLTLSGGLDSRAILAAMPDNGNRIQAATFGKEGCDDIVLASAASKVKGAAHHIVNINADNWLHPRVGGVWYTDGHLDLMHMHVLAVKPIIKKLFNISLDGFLGDAVIGGGYGSKSQMIEKLDNRGRRFIVLGSRLLRDDVESRFPFFDNQFLEKVIALPEGLLKDARLYRKMLIGRFPEFFRTIPWQKTGSVISWPNKREIVKHRYKDARSRLLQLPGLWRLENRNKNKSRNYADYASWMRDESSRLFIEEVLYSPSALYVDYLPKERVADKLARHMNGEDHSELIGRFLTFEIWLQQVFEGRLRPNIAAT